MRDYPQVPNVFRVASTHSINNDGNAAGGGTFKTAANVRTTIGQQQQQQQQYQQQIRLQQNGNFITEQQQQQQLQQHYQQQHKQQNQSQTIHQQSIGPTSSATTTHPATTSNTNSLPQNGKQQKRLQQPQNSGHIQTHQLTTSASIERAPYVSGRRDNSPYATLPRSINGLSNPNLSQQQQQQQKQQYNKQQNNKGSIGDRVINSISGSIPATGFANARRSTSDLNIAMGNSFTDLNNINAIGAGDIMDDLLLVNYHKQSEDFQRADGNLNYNYRRQPLAMSQYPCGRNKQNGSGYLWILTPVAASISVAIVIAALAGPQWLFTEEKLPNANYNGTANFNALDDGAFITKYTKSSLWILCSTLQGVDTYNCIKIDYFPNEGYQPDPLDSTPAVAYTVTKSCPFFLAAGIFLLISFIVFLIPTCSHQNNLYYFSAGIMFIVSGLLMLIGLIAYISILKAEIGSKLRPRSTLQPALFKVTYGQSFFLFVFGFIATEFVGLLNIFLYIGLQEVSYYSRLPCFTISNIHEKIREGENPRGQHNTYKSYKHETTPMDQKPLQKPRHQVHTVQLPEPQDLEDYNRKLQNTGTCRKHPEADRRIYFEKTSAQCNVHSKSLAKSLHELPASSPPPPPSLNKKHQQATHFADLPQEFPLTRSVSTTTDIYTTANALGMAATVNDNTPHVERKSRRNMATNTRPTDTEMSASSAASERKSDGVVPRRRPATEESKNTALLDAYDEEPQRLCGLKRGIRKTKDELFQEFCKRAGVRPKPKNIYYIANEEDDEADGQRRHTNGTEDDEEAFKTLTGNEERIYVMDDNTQVFLQPGRNLRRSSMYVEPTHLRKLNSNLSLHSLYPPTEKMYQKSLLDLERCDSSLDVWSPYPEAYYSKGLPTFGGSQQRLQLLDHRNQPLYQSRTLPRSFVRRNGNESQDSIASNSLHASAGALHSLYGASQARLTNHLMLQQQHQQQQQRLLSISRDNCNAPGLYQSHLSVHQSTDDMLRAQLQVQQPQQQLQQQQQQQQQHQLQYPSQVTMVNLQPGAVQWPAAIPTSPSNFPSKYQIYAPATNGTVSVSNTGSVAVSQNANGAMTAHFPHAILARSFSGASNTASTVGSVGVVSQTAAAATPASLPKFQRAYAFDEQRRASAAHGDAFDLDEIERERRRSHASLFTGGAGGVAGAGHPNAAGSFGSPNTDRYDTINGTAV